VVIVTNLNDSGPGSLRWALEEVKGPRTVVFEVAGAIELKTQILIRDPFVTIAGQSAPGDGITIEGARIRVKADEVIIRGLHFRPGDGEGGQDAGDRDGLFIGTTDFEINNVVIDHNTFTWAVDENLTVNGRVRDISISNNIIAQGLSDSIHPKGEHSKGMLISNWEGAADWASNISVVGNLFAGNQQRNPEVRSGQNVEIVNNFIYDYGLGRAAIAVGGGNGGTLTTSVFIIGNVMMAGPDTSSATAPIAISAMGTGSAVYIADNLWQARGQAGLSGQQGTAFGWDAGGLQYVTTQFGGSGLNVLSASNVIASVLSNAGASPSHRDDVDARIIEAVRTGGALIVDSVAEAGGYAPAGTATAAADFDRDGMPDWFESLYGFESRTFDANGDKDGDGYTNIEEYLNGLITGFALPLSGQLAATTASAGRTDVLWLGPDGIRSPVHVTGMNAAEGDRIDISALLAAVPAGQKVADYISTRTVNGETVVFFDSDGSATAQQARIVAVVGTVPVPGSVTAPAALAPPPAPVVRELLGTELADRLRGGEGIDRLVGAGGDDDLAGGAGADRLEGGEGKDKLDGGVGADTMIGGAGDDFYIVDNAMDSVIETAGGGVDSVTTSASFALGADVENLTLSGASNIDGSGNNLANKITGNTGDNHLVGLAGADDLRGGAGRDLLEGGADNDKLDGGLDADLMIGGAGDDSYVVDNTMDIVLEDANAASGVDSVTATVSFTLGSNIENLMLAGVSNIDGSGNTLANKITGNAGDNHLLGLAGADDLRGGAGRDLLEGGADNDKLDGGAGDDCLIGGLGWDTLIGAAGADTFVFGAGDTSLDGARLDCIADFQRGSDVIRINLLDGGVLTSVAGTSINSNAYKTAFTAAEKALGGAEDAVYVSGATDAWLFWDDPATAAAIDGAILIRNGGLEAINACTAAQTGSLVHGLGNDILFQSYA
jgi:Ca2+-binding RTX toxin-like protein